MWESVTGKGLIVWKVLSLSSLHYRYYLDGSSWHPVIGPFGPMDCVMCQCNSGNIVCNRFKCPSRAELPCVKPAKQFGQCCPICPITGITEKITPWGRDFLKRWLFSCPRNSIFYGSQRIITKSTIALIQDMSWANWIQSHTITPYISVININLSLPFTTDWSILPY